MRKIATLVFILASISSFAQEVAERDNTPKYSNEFMNIGVSARAFGMGFTAVSFIDDATSGYWNPAGLNNLEPDNQLVLMHSSYFGGLANYDYLSFAKATDSLSHISFSVIRFAVDDIPDTRFLIDVNGSINYDNIRFFSSADYGFLFSYARKLDILGGLDFGGNLKVIHRSVGSFSKAWGFGLDFGIQQKRGKWNLGLIGRDLLGTFNAWSHNVEEVEATYALTGNDVPVNSLEITLPRLILGISRTFQIHRHVGMLASSDLEFTFDGKRNTLVSTDFSAVDPRFGLEFDYKKVGFLRMGINQFQEVKDFDGSMDWTFQPNFGVGVKVRELTIDYALTDIGNLAPGLFSHVFSIKVDFNAKN